MKNLKLVIGSAIGLSMTLISASLPLQAQPNPQSNWYNCLTRERFTPQKAAWCNQMQQMMNAAYTVPDVGRVTLQNGKVDDRTNQTNVQLVNREGFVATGDLNGDGASDMVTVLVANPGGSGSFVYLVAGLQQGSQMVTTNPILLGDRVQVRSIQVRDGKVQVDMLEQGPDDPMCCPTQEAQKTYQLGYGLLPIEER